MASKAAGPREKGEQATGDRVRDRAGVAGGGRGPTRFIIVVHQDGQRRRPAHDVLPERPELHARQTPAGDLRGQRAGSGLSGPTRAGDLSSGLCAL